MKKNLLLLTLFFFASAAMAAERIVSLKPTVTELIFALGKGGELVGDTRWCDRPAEAKSLTKVGDYMHADIETILALRPTMVIGSRENSTPFDTGILARNGTRVVLLPFTTFEDYYASTLALANLLGVKEQGERLVKEMQDTLAGFKPLKKKALAIVGKRPLMAAGRGTFIDEAMRTMGLVNVAGQGVLYYPAITEESLIVADPDVIIDLTMGSETKDTSFWKKLPTLRAVSGGHVIQLSMSDFRMGPSLAASLKKLYKDIE